MIFAIGQDITPLRKAFKIVMMPEGQDMTMPFPQFGKVYKVKGYTPEPWGLTGQWYLFLEEFPENCIYCENSFAPVITDEQLSEALKSEVAEVNAH